MKCKKRQPDNSEEFETAIDNVQQLVEQCLQLYMTKVEALKVLLDGNMDPKTVSIVYIVWQRMEKEYPEFFRPYYVNVMLRKVISRLNKFLEHQIYLMMHRHEGPLISMDDEINPTHVNSLPMVRFNQQQSLNPIATQPHVDSMNSGISSYHVVNEVTGSSRFHTDPMNNGDNMASMAPIILPSSVNSFMSEMAALASSSAANMAPIITPSCTNSFMSETAVNPTLVSSTAANMAMAPVIPPSSSISFVSDMLVNPTVPFTTMDTLGAEVGTSAPGTTFTSNVISPIGSQLAPSTDAVDFGDFLDLSDTELTFDFPGLQDWTLGYSVMPSDKEVLIDIPWQENLMLADSGTLRDSSGSSFLSPDSDILLDIPGQENLVSKEFFLPDHHALNQAKVKSFYPL